MSEAQNPDVFEAAYDPYEPEDQETLDAIDRGIRDAKAGRFVTSDQARRLVHRWIAESEARSSR